MRSLAEDNDAVVPTTDPDSGGTNVDDYASFSHATQWNGPRRWFRSGLRGLRTKRLRAAVGPTGTRGRSHRWAAGVVLAQ